MKKHLHFVAFLFGIAATGFLHAQTFQGSDAENIVPGAKLIVMSKLSLSPSFIAVNDKTSITSEGILQWMQNALKLKGKDGLKLFQRNTDELGWELQRYNQTYDGITVEGAVYLVHLKNGLLVSANGEFFDHINIITVPSITEKRALKKALEYTHANLYMWQDKAAEARLKEGFSDPSRTFYPKGELVIKPVGGDYTKKDFRLCYKFDIYAEKPLKRQYVYVDAGTGKIIYTEDRIKDAFVTATASTLYSGTQTMTVDNTSGPYRLRDGTRGNGVNTYNLKNGSSYAAAVDFTNTSTTWNVTGADQCATDAHWGAEVVYDFYKSRFSRNSIDGSGYNLLSYVHYNSGYDNAFWDGTEMNYGDGDGSGYSYFTALDVCGHEISHGLTAFTSNLQYSNESGAIDEGMSDCMGTSIEFYGWPSKANFLIGEDITIPYGGIRSMANPKAFQQPDTYMGTNWYTGTADNGGVHTNSGVLNHWYYLVAMGGSGTNDIGSAYSVSGVGVIEAAAITFRTNTVYLTTTSQYSDCRTFSIQAATDLYGACSKEVIATENAWYAVGVGAAPAIVTLNAAFAPNGSTFCSAPANVTFTNSTSGGNVYTWNFGDGSTSAATSPVHNYTTAGTYVVTLIANQTGTCPQKDTVKTVVEIAPATTPAVTNASSCGPASLNLGASAANGGELNWYTSSTGGSPINVGKSYTTPTLNSTTTYYVEHAVGDSSQYVGIKNDSIGTGGILSYNHYDVFNVSANCTLSSVKIYTDSAGSRTIALENSTGTTLLSTPVNLIAGTNIVTLNYSLAAGTSYRLTLASGSKIRLFRTNAGAAYPYNIGGLISIDSSDAGKGYYYFFYNWAVKAAGCLSGRVPVTASIYAIPTANVTLSNDTLTCTTSATSYQWYMNGTLIPGATAAYYVETGNGNYTVVITDANGCNATSSPIIVSGIASLTSSNTYRIYPNPASEMITVEGQNIAKCEMFNVIGQNMLNEHFNSAGTILLSIKYIPNGIYFMRITNNAGNRCTEKVVVSK